MYYRQGSGKMKMVEFIFIVIWAGMLLMALGAAAGGVGGMVFAFIIFLMIAIPAIVVFNEEIEDMIE
jgi:hypothetical protein